MSEQASDKGKITTYALLGKPILDVTQSEMKTAELSLDQTLEYQLKVEDHADNFFEIKHKITFFVITAAVGSMGYTLNFSIGRLGDITLRPERIVCLIVAVFLGLLTIGVALLSMYYDSRNYAFNLRAYFSRKLYDALSDDEKDKWATLRSKATRYQRFGFTFLFLSILYQAAVFVMLVL